MSGLKDVKDIKNKFHEEYWDHEDYKDHISGLGITVVDGMPGLSVNLVKGFPKGLLLPWKFYEGVRIVYHEDHDWAEALALESKVIESFFDKHGSRDIDKNVIAHAYFNDIDGKRCLNVAFINERPKDFPESFTYPEDNSIEYKIIYEENFGVPTFLNNGENSGFTREEAKRIRDAFNEKFLYSETEDVIREEYSEYLSTGAFVETIENLVENGNVVLPPNFPKGECLSYAISQTIRDIPGDKICGVPRNGLCLFAYLAKELDDDCGIPKEEFMGMKIFYKNMGGHFKAQEGKEQAYS